MEKIDLTGAIDLLHEFLTLQGKAENTIKGYLADIRSLFRELEIDVIILDNLERTCAQWLNNSKGACSANTVRRRLATCKNLATACDQSILKRYTSPTPAAPIPHPLPGGIADLTKMISAASSHDHKVLVTLMGLCGLRVSEARAVGPNDFHCNNQQSGPLLSVRGKGSRNRLVPVQAKAWEILAPAVVQAQTEGRSTLLNYADRTARNVITALGEKAGITKSVASHDLRATFATVVYRRTKDIEVVRRLLGHARVEQTQVYIGISLEQMTKAAEFMGDDE